MNHIKRLLLGAFSTLLLAAGFARAASNLDPVSNDLTGSSIQQMRDADNCVVSMCDEVGH